MPTREQIVEMVIGDQILALEETVIEFINSLGELSPLDASYAMLARKLARKIDRDAGMATAAIGRELRDTLSMLAPIEPDKPDDFWSHFTSDVSTEIRDTSQL